MATISGQLHAALQQITRPGSFCVSGSSAAPLPGLEVTGIGPVGLPLNVSSARELITMCKQAPYGKGEKTLVDTSVRRVWQLDPVHFSLTNPDWLPYLADVVKSVERELGLAKQKLKSHLYSIFNSLTHANETVPLKSSRK